MTHHSSLITDVTPLPSQLPITIQPDPLLPAPRFKFVDVALVLVIFVLLAAVIAPGFTLATYHLLARIGLPIPVYPLPVLLQVSVQETLALAVIVLIALLRGLTLADFGFRPVGVHWLLAGLGLTAVLMPVRIGLGLLAHFATGGTLENLAPMANERVFPIIGSPAIAGVPIIFMAGIVAPLIEELIFRAILYTWLRQKIGIAPAAFASAVIFGMIHPTIANAVAAIVIGVAFALLYEKSRSLWVPLILHVINNTVLMVLAFFAIGLGEMFGGLMR